MGDHSPKEEEKERRGVMEGEAEVFRMKELELACSGQAGLGCEGGGGFGLRAAIPTLQQMSNPLLLEWLTSLNHLLQLSKGRAGSGGLPPPIINHLISSEQSTEPGWRKHHGTRLKYSPDPALLF